MSLLHRRRGLEEGEATSSRVAMLDRMSYGEAEVQVTYAVRPLTTEPFDVTLEAKVRMLQLPQAGQRVRVSFDPGNHGRFEVLTPPGEETGEVTTRTVEIPWAGFGPLVVHLPRRNPRLSIARLGAR